MKWVILLWIALCSSCSIAGIVVVTAKETPVQVLTEQQVENIFLSRTNRLPNGDLVVPLELKKGKNRAEFYQRIAGKSPTQLSAYWTTLVFSGRGRPPKGIGNLDSLVSKLEKTRGAISYLDEEEVPSELKVIYRFSN